MEFNNAEDVLFQPYTVLNCCQATVMLTRIDLRNKWEIDFLIKYETFDSCEE